MAHWDLSKICTCGLKKQPCKRHVYDRDEFNKSLRTMGSIESINRENWERALDSEIFYCTECDEEYSLPEETTDCPICGSQLHND